MSAQKKGLVLLAIVCAIVLAGSWAVLKLPAIMVERDCASGDAQACVLTGQWLVADQASARDVGRGEQRLLDGCRANDFAACLSLSAHLAPKSMAVEDQLAEVEELQAGCRGGDEFDCIWMAAHGWKPLQGVNLATSEKRCAGGDLPSCWVLTRHAAMDKAEELDGLCKRGLKPACDVAKLCGVATEPRCGEVGDGNWSKIVGPSAFEEAPPQKRHAALQTWVESGTFSSLRDELATVCGTDVVACNLALLLDTRSAGRMNIQHEEFSQAVVRHACAAGDDAACRKYGAGSSEAAAEVAPGLAQKCDQGDDEACVAYVRQTLKNPGGESVVPIAERLCEQGKTGMCESLMAFYSSAGRGPNGPEKVRELAARLCSLGVKYHCL